MIPDNDDETNYDHPDVVMPLPWLAGVGAWALLLVVVLAPVCGVALLAVRLKTLALRAVGRPAVAAPTLEEIVAGTGARR